MIAWETVALKCCRHKHAFAKASIKILSSWRGACGEAGGIGEGVGRCFLVAALIGCSFKVLSKIKVAGCRKVKRKVRI